MQVYFLRHADATWPNWDRPDDERPLTKKGKKQSRRVGKWLANHGVNPSVVLTSPLPRASETAEIAVNEIGAQVQVEPALGKSFNAQQLMPLLVKYAGQDIVLVGHEPDFSTVIGALTGGAVKLAKAGVARVDVGDARAGRGELVWLLTPNILKKKKKV